MNIYADDIDTALELITEFGSVCQWIKPPPVDPFVKPWRSNSLVLPIKYPVQLVVLSEKDLGYGSLSGDFAVEGTEVASTRKIALMAGNQIFVPELTDSIELASGVVEIFKIETLAPNQIPILHTVWFKQ